MRDFFEEAIISEEEAESQRDEFEDATRSALLRCSEWLKERSDDLAKSFASGCRNWSITFSAGSKGLFPHVDISVSQIDRDMMKAYSSLVSDEVRRENQHMAYIENEYYRYHPEGVVDLSEILE